jgi:hypothetical protein
MLIDAWKGRVEFPELKRIALEQYGTATGNLKQLS